MTTATGMLLLPPTPEEAPQPSDGTSTREIRTHVLYGEVDSSMGDYTFRQAC